MKRCDRGHTPIPFAGANLRTSLWFFRSSHPALHDAVVAEFAGHAETVWTGTTICTTIDSAGANADRNDGSRAPDGYRIRAESYFYTDPLECHPAPGADECALPTMYMMAACLIMPRSVVQFRPPVCVASVASLERPSWGRGDSTLRPRSGNPLNMQ